MSSRNDIGFEIEIRNMRGMCAEYGQRMSKEMEVVRRYTGRTIKIRNSGLLDSFTCGGIRESLFDQRLIPLGFARSFACWARSGDRESVVNKRNGDFSAITEAGQSVLYRSRRSLRAIAPRLLFGTQRHVQRLLGWGSHPTSPMS